MLARSARASRPAWCGSTTTRTRSALRRRRGAGGAPRGSVRRRRRYGLYTLSRTTFVDVDRGRLTPGWWYPYSERAVDGFRGVLGGLYADGRRALGPGRSGPTAAASRTWSRECCDERALARRPGDRRGADGRRRRQARVTPARGGAGPCAHGRRRRPSASARSRRETRSRSPASPASRPPSARAS